MQNALNGQRPSRAAVFQGVESLLATRPELRTRFERVSNFARTVRVSEYHVTNSCNIRCKGCWFFLNDFDKASVETKQLDELRDFVKRESARGINSALLIGGEPTLFPQRIGVYVEEMQHVSISTNGLRRLPRSGFENVNVFISLFGGGDLDDELRAYKPSGRRFSGLFEQSLQNYRNDERACFIYAITEIAVEHIEDTVRRIEGNGNRVMFNFYSQYDQDDPLRMDREKELLEEALRVREKYAQVVLSTPYYIETMITGTSHWGRFGYDVCPSISIDHPAHTERRQNGHRTLPLFNTYAPDLKTLNFCCTSGHCADCRDSQAINSWLLVSLEHFLEDANTLQHWIELSEAYWRQFVWYPHRTPAKPSTQLSPPKPALRA